jgi:hypothetical protein
MGFIIKKISDVGSGNPIVARLSLQFGNILNFYELDDDVKESIKTVLYSDIQKRLVSCDKIAKEITSEIEAAISTLEQEGIKTQSSGRVIESPHIINLDERLESYLYNAKSCLRDSLKIYNLAFGSEFTEARFDKAITWAENEFGCDDAITKFLKANHDLWIKNLIKMRNAIEHPGGYSGHLHVTNFEVKTTEAGTSIHEPMWHLNDDTPSNIKRDLNVLVSNILELTEEIVLSVLSKHKKPDIVCLIEIPEEKRREESPIRFRIGLPQEIESNTIQVRATL